MKRINKPFEVGLGGKFHSSVKVAIIEISQRCSTIRLCVCVCVRARARALARSREG
jgi:hypothetical protein